MPVPPESSCPEPAWPPLPDDLLPNAQERALQDAIIAMDEADMDAVRSLVADLDPEPLGRRDKGRFAALKLAVLAGDLDDASHPAWQAMPDAQRDYRSDIPTDEVAPPVVAALDQLLGHEPFDRIMLMELGLTLSDYGEVAMAQRVFARLARTPIAESDTIAPDSPSASDAVAWFNLAQTFSLQRRLDEALAAYRQCLDADDLFTPALRELGRCLQVNGDLANAAKAIVRYLQAEPNDQSERINLAIVYSDAGRFREAAKLLNQARKALNPTQDEDLPTLASLWFNGAVIASRTADRDSIEVCREEMATHCPDDWRTRLIGAMAAELDEDDEAAWERLLDAYDAAMSISRDEDPDSAEAAADTAAHWLGRFAVTRGDRAHCEEFLDAMFHDQYFTEPSLSLMRVAMQMNRVNADSPEQHGLTRPSTRYSVVIEGQLSDAEREHWRMDDAEGYFRVVEVFARGDRQAGTLAAKFQTRCAEGSGAKEPRIRVWEVVRHEDVGEQHVGVCRVEAPRFYRPGQRPDPPKPV